MWFSAAARVLAERYGDPEVGIAQLARALLKSARLQGPPFYPDDLAKYCGVTHIRNRRIPGHGLLLQNADGLVVYVNRRYPWRSPQWNAICAHELGHVLLSQANPRALDGQNEWVDEDELLANRAARELLLPELEVRSVVATGQDDVDALPLAPLADHDAPHFLLQRVAEVFRTPLRMTAHRFAETGVWRDLILFWQVEDQEPVLKNWWPAHHPASRLLRRHADARSLLGPDNEVQRAAQRETIGRGLDSNFPARGIAWLIQSLAFTEYGRKCVVSFIRTGEMFRP
ncbi:MAG: ImmA/IrrE family metallo-endopeptidase [bacterium]